MRQEPVKCATCSENTKNVALMMLFLGWRLYYVAGVWAWYCPGCETPFEKEKTEDEHTD